MQNRKTFFRMIVDAFEDLVVFVQKRTLASIGTVLLLMIIAMFSMGMYFLYRNSSEIITMLRETHKTPTDLQAGLQLSVEEHLQIDRILTDELLKSKNASNVLFFKFHDSKTDLQGKHDFFYSAMNEITRPGNPYMLGHLQNVPITGMGQYMVPFLEHKCQTVKTAEIIGNDWLKGSLEADKIITLSSCPVYDESRMFLIGFVEIVYTDPNDQILEAHYVETCLAISANKVSNVISKEIIK